MKMAGGNLEKYLMTANKLNLSTHLFFAWLTLQILPFALARLSCGSRGDLGGQEGGE